jgi:hypothetical protein
LGPQSQFLLFLSFFLPKSLCYKNLFVGFAYQGKVVVFRFIIEYI